MPSSSNRDDRPSRFHGRINRCRWLFTNKPWVPSIFFAGNKHVEKFSTVVPFKPQSQCFCCLVLKADRDRDWKRPPDMESGPVGRFDRHMRSITGTSNYSISFGFFPPGYITLTFHLMPSVFAFWTWCPPSCKRCKKKKKKQREKREGAVCFWAPPQSHPGRERPTLERTLLVWSTLQRNPYTSELPSTIFLLLMIWYIIILLLSFSFPVVEADQWCFWSRHSFKLPWLHSKGTTYCVGLHTYLRMYNYIHGIKKGRAHKQNFPRYLNTIVRYVV